MNSHDAWYDPIGTFTGSVLIWLFLTLFGLGPLGLAWMKSVFRAQKFNATEFFKDGSLLFFGPAVLCATVGELTITGAYEGAFLPFIFIILCALSTVIVASIIYGDMYDLGLEQKHRQQDGAGLCDSLVRILSVRLAICSLTLSLSLTTVFNYKHLLEKRSLHDAINTATAAKTEEKADEQSGDRREGGTPIH